MSFISLISGEFLCLFSRMIVSFVWDCFFFFLLIKVGVVKDCEFVVEQLMNLEELCVL